MPTFPGRLGALVALVLAFPVIADDAGLRAALVAERARPPAARIERADFIVRAAVDDVTLSPDGGTLAFVRGVDADRSLWLMSTGSDKERRILARTDALSLSWSRDGQWLFVVSPRNLFALRADGAAGSRTLVALGGPERREFMGVDPVGASATIVRERTRDASGELRDWRLSRVGTDGRVTVIDESPDRPSGYAFDRDGRLAYLQHMRDDAWVVTHIANDGSRDDVLRCERMHRCTLWPRVGNDGLPWFEGDIGGSLSCVQRLNGEGAMENVECDPRREVDVDDLVEDPVTGLPAIATFRGSVVANQALDAASGRHVDVIRQRFTGRNLTIRPGVTRWLVIERDASLQGDRFHLYEPASGHFTEVLAALPVTARDAIVARWLPENALARKLPFNWFAADGMRLHGFVWVPPGVDASTLPLVALIHGGPWNHAAAATYGAGYTQLLVNRGYVVFEPNFRGSTGYGRDYMLAADGDFGNGRVQQDIVDGVRALLGQGVGDPARVGIVGASFGGYSTLLGLTFQPDLFKVGVAIVPPADFAWDLAWIARSREGNVLSVALPFERWMAMVSLDLADRDAMDRLHVQAPLANASHMDRPLLIVAGGEDQRVALRGVLGYAARLRSLGKPVTLLVDPQAGHTNTAPLARETTLYLMIDMLHRHLGGAADTPPDPAMRTYLDANLRAGASENAKVAAPAR